jgi:CRISPR-associated protein Cas5d
MAYGIRLLVWGQHGLFTRPEMKVERVSYEVMTPSAARGILEAIHWKPAIVWRIDRIQVLNRIRFQSIRRNEVGHKAPAGKIKQAMNRGDLAGLQLLVDEDRQQRAATVLVKPRYLIEAHFDLTAKAGAEDSEGKHLDIFNRRAEETLNAEHGFGTPRDLGFMLWDIDHAAPCRPSLFFRATLRDGVMEVPTPDSPEVRR